MTFLDWMFAKPDDKHDAEHVSVSNLRHYQRHELSRGWDGPVWRTGADDKDRRPLWDRRSRPLKAVKRAS